MFQLLLGNSENGTLTFEMMFAAEVDYETVDKSGYSGKGNSNSMNHFLFQVDVPVENEHE